MTELEANIDVPASGKEAEAKATTANEKHVEVNGHTHGEVASNVTTKASSEAIEGNEQITKEEPYEAVPKAVDSVVIEEELKKEEEAPPSPPKVILYQPPPGRQIPSMSPFCLKLETYLRLNTIPYENHYGYKVGKKGKVPWIEYKGERKPDSNFIVQYLNETFKINMDSELTAEQLAIGRAVKTMVEENTYWAYIYSSYIDNFNEFKKVVAPEAGAGIGFSVSMKMNQRKARSQLDGQGMGRHSREEIYEIAQQDIKAVSTLLGEKKFLFGEKPTTFDCTLFGLFANILWGGIDSPLTSYVASSASNIVNFCQRVKELCWQDWADMILGERPEPQLKKGFSFRKTKKKVKAPKENSAEQEANSEATKEGEAEPKAVTSLPESKNDASVEKEDTKYAEVEKPSEKEKDEAVDPDEKPKEEAKNDEVKSDDATPADRE